MINLLQINIDFKLSSQKSKIIMKLFYTPLFTLLFLFSITNLWSQTNETVSPCGTTEMLERYIKNHPEEANQIIANDAELEAFTEEFINSKMDEDTLWIPVVFHIIHLNGSENISNDLVHESIARLNIDYMALNGDLDQIDPEFQPLIPETFIQFRLATKDPNGNCTSGITRTVSAQTNIGDQPDLGLLIQWPRNKYMNVWVVRDIELGAAAYTYRPGTFINNNPVYDGIVNRYDYLGFNQHTLTHEVGHWFNLLHVWGNSNNAGLPGNCSEDDFVNDTPLTTGNLGGCNLAYVSCGSHDNVQNYMNYSSCGTENFTQGQSDRMRAALNSNMAQRNNLWTPSNLAATGIDVIPTLCTADFHVTKNLICIDEEIQFIDDSYNGEIATWEWTFEGGIPETSIEENPYVYFGDAGMHSISLTVTDGENEVSTVKSDYIRVLPVGVSTPYNEIFDEASTIPNSYWFVISGDNNKWNLTTDAAAVGDKSVYLRNRIQSEDEKDELISSTVDLSSFSDGVLSFKFAFARKTDGDSDKMRVRITRNCGETWVVKKTIKASTGTMVTAPNQFSEFIPETDEWGEVSINLSSLYYIDNFRYKFEFTNGGGNNVYIDDIKIYDPTFVGINEVNKRALNYQVYPNPINNQLNIEFNLLEKTAILGEIYDVTGRKVKTLFNNDYSLGTHRLDFDTSDLKAGLYFVKISLEGESFTKRVIKS
jgi:PKD repeat protein